MPVFKVPSIHKFGIISHCQRLQLQNRLLDEINESKKTTKPKKNPYEITDEFVTNYNECLKNGNKDMSKKYKDLGHDLLMKTKRKLGVQFNCEGQSQINLPVGWTEIAILTQCNGKLGEDSLVELLQSLTCAPISVDCLPVLLYILETSMYFIHTTEVDQSMPQKQLRWLQVGELAALRLFIHQKTSMIKIKEEHVDNLKVYMKTFLNYQPSYSKYPEILISFKVIMTVANYLLLHTVESIDKTLKHEQIEMEHDETSLLWHSIDLWRCCYYSGLQHQLQDAEIGIRHCLEKNAFSYGQWIECYVAIKVIASAASFHITGLNIFVGLLHGIMDKVEETRKPIDDDNSDNLNDEMKILYLSIIKEFSQLSIYSKSSYDKEQALNFLAQFALHSVKPTLGKGSNLSDYQSLLLTRIYTVYELVTSFNNSNNNSHVTNTRISYDVIVNSLWTLIGAIGRKWSLNADEMFEFTKLGAFFNKTIHVSENAHAGSSDINFRISILLTEIFLPINFSGISSPNVPESKYKEKVDSSFSKKIKVNRKLIKNEIANQLNQKKPMKPAMPVDTKYTRSSEQKLKNITQHYWDNEYGELEKKIDEIVLNEFEIKDH